MVDHDLLVIRPWVCWWEENGKRRHRRLEYEASAMGMCHHYNEKGDRWARVVFGPDGEKFPVELP